MDICHKIHETSRQLFFSKGIKSVSLDDISHELGMSKKTLYKCIDSKEELLNILVEDKIAQEKQLIDNIVSNSKHAIDELFLMFQFNAKKCLDMSPLFLEDLQRNYSSVWKKMEDHMNDTIPQNIIANIYRGQKENLYLMDVNTEFIAYLYTKNVQNMIQYFIHQNNESLSSLFNSFFIYHVQGICTLKGRETLDQVLQIKNN